MYFTFDNLSLTYRTAPISDTEDSLRNLTRAPPSDPRTFDPASIRSAC